MKFLTREEILAVEDLPHTDICVNEWGGWVRVRTLRGIDRANLIASVASNKEDGSVPGDWTERMVIACTTDDKGNQIFTADDIAELSKKNSVVLQKLFDEADKLNTVTGKSAEKLKGE